MIRDPLYHEIIERLNGELHEEAFERCAQALLRPIYPSLVPIRGGRDAGRDGITADLDDSQLVLIATAGDRVKRNLETSLNSMVSNGVSCRKVVCAISRALSAEKQDELRDAAGNLGFHVVQIYERAGMANLLYESPKWCKELLGLTGDPPPLSIIPRSCRPMITDLLIGREEDARWLTETDGDRLLVGQPGSGKTFILSALAKLHEWLFVATHDLGRIASGIRSQGPAALLVDDAHLEPRFLTELAHLRKEINSQVPIIATCWPGAKDSVVETLGLPQSRVIELRPLTRPEIAQVLEAAGIRGPERLVYQILNQADGRVGLAITLANLCLEGDQRDLDQVILGDVLLRSVRTTFESLVGPLSIDLLAAFAVGGSAGMQMKVISEYLQKSLADIRLAATQLAAGGIIDDIDGRHYSVRPPELRYALIREVFFAGAASLDIEPLLRAAPSLHATTETLVNSCHFGAAVPADLLRRLLEESGMQTSWEAYAWLGGDESRWILRRHPEQIVSIAQPSLALAPETAIPLLLARSLGDNRALHSHPEHPMRLIEDWVKGGLPGTAEAVTRRRALINAVGEWLKTGGQARIGMHALAIAIAPSFSSHSTDPVLGNTVTIRRGLPSLDEIEGIAGLWNEIIKFTEQFAGGEWAELVHAVSDWVYPQQHTNTSISSMVYTRMREIAVQMLQDIARVGHHHRGLMHRASELAGELEIELDLEPDADFEILFPTIPDNSAQHLRQSRAITELAQVWATQCPREIIERVVLLEKEAASVGESNRQTPWLADQMARQVENPLEWIGAIVTAGAPGDLVASFLAKAALIKAAGWEDVAVELLTGEATRYATIAILLTVDGLSPALLRVLMESLVGVSKTVEVQCLRNVVPESTLRCLLTHKDDSVASSAAIGVWVADPKGVVPDGLQDLWDKAVLRGNRREYWLGEIFKEKKQLGFEFLRKEITSENTFWSEHDHATRETLKALSVDQRRILLDELPDDFRCSEFVRMLVGQDIELYRSLVAAPRLRPHHLAPMNGRPDEGNWIIRAKAALDAGIAPRDIALAALEWSSGWINLDRESDLWTSSLEAFQKIQSDEDERIREVAEEGIEIARTRRESSIAQKRGRETYARR